MNDGIIARRYATALFKLGKETDQLELYYSDCNQLQSVLMHDKTFHFLLNNTVISKKNKKSILKNVFATYLHADILRFLDLLVNKGREEYLHDIITSFFAVYQSFAGIQQVTFTTAYTYNDKTLDKIITLLETQTGLKTNVKRNIDENLIGGFLLRVGDKQMDASVRGQLNRIRKELSN